MKECDQSAEQWDRIEKNLNKYKYGDYAIKQDRKKQRKLKKISQIVQHDAFRKSEDVHCQPQGFHGNLKN